MIGEKLRKIEGEIIGIKRRINAARRGLQPRYTFEADEAALRELKDQARALRAKEPMAIYKTDSMIPLLPAPKGN